MAKKVNYHNFYKNDGVNLDGTEAELVFLRDSSKDDLVLAQQSLLIDANAVDAVLDVILQDGALFTWVTLDEVSVNNNVSLKLNGSSVDLFISPELWVEGDITAITASNNLPSTQSINIFQLYALEVGSGSQG